MNETISLLIIEPNKEYRRYFSLFLSLQGINVADQCANYEEAEELYNTLKPDIVIMNINNQAGNICDAGKSITDYPDIKIIGQSTHYDNLLLNKLIAAGAAGYFIKLMPPAKILEAIEKIYNGEKLFYRQYE